MQVIGNDYKSFTLAIQLHHTESHFLLGTLIFYLQMCIMLCTFLYFILKKRRASLVEQELLQS